MASDAFNSLGGYTVGIPPVPVIDANGNVVTNVFTPGNVTANAFYSDGYFFANGEPYIQPAAGNTTEIQFNSNGSFAGNPNLTFDSSIELFSTTNLTVSGLTDLGDVANITILGGNSGYFLQTDGAGNLIWAAGGGGGGNGSPGGINTQVQFNDAGEFGAASGFTYNKGTGLLTVGNLYVPGSATVNGNLSVTGNISVGNITGNITNANYATYSTHVLGNSQPNIDLVGNLIGLVVSNAIGGVNFANTSTVLLGDVGNLHITGGENGYYLQTDGEGNLTWALGGGGGNGSPGGANSQVQYNDNGLFGGNPGFVFQEGNTRLIANNFVATSTANLGYVANVTITGGSNNQVLTTDGAGNLRWSSSGGQSAGGGNTTIQFNNGGFLDGSPYLTYNSSTHAVNIAGNLVANTFQVGSGVYKFCVSTVYFATTTSTAANQVLWSVPVTDVSAVDFMIISTDEAGGTRQTSKISATYFNGLVAYNEYAGLHINGGVGSFSVGYDPGSILAPPSLQLKVTPDSSALTNYKMMIVEYAP